MHHDIISHVTDDSDIRRPPEQWRLCELLQHSGLGFAADERQRLIAQDQLLVNDQPAELNAGFAAGDRVSIEGVRYTVSQAAPRPQLVSDTMFPDRQPGRVRVHAGYHKCLTMYSRRVYEKLCKAGQGTASAFRHFYHRVDHFNHLADRFAVTSVSGHMLDLDRFSDIRVVRFIRDPRDLLISGYFYHLKAKEPWCELRSPIDSDWIAVNGCVPEGLKDGESLQQFLQRIPPGEGLLAEIEFRRAHFASMREWNDDPRVRIYRYEDVLGNESAVFADVAAFLGLPWRARLNARRYARRFSAGRKKADSAHIRNPNAGQWQNHFTPEVTRVFEREHGDLLAKYGYR